MVARRLPGSVRLGLRAAVRRRPGRGRRRRRTTASACVALSSSTPSSSTPIRSRLTCRMSSYTRPCVAATMSPASALIAKLRPSTTTRSWRPLVGTLPARRWCSDIRPLCTTNPADAHRGEHERRSGRYSPLLLNELHRIGYRLLGKGSCDEHLVRRTVPGLRPATDGRSRRAPGVSGLPADLPAADGSPLPVRGARVGRPPGSPAPPRRRRHEDRAGRAALRGGPARGVRRDGAGDRHALRRAGGPGARRDAVRAGEVRRPRRSWSRSGSRCARGSRGEELVNLAPHLHLEMMADALPAGRGLRRGALPPRHLVAPVRRAHQDAHRPDHARPPGPRPPPGSAAALCRRCRWCPSATTSAGRSPTST